MATDSRSLLAFFNADADFQAWCQGLAAQLVAAGMVKTTDTGQINNATVTKPGAANTAQGYEIYKFSDALQASYPIFFKIEYGSATAATDPGIWITVGQSSNGAGTITGTVTARIQIRSGGTKSNGVSLTSYCSGDGSRLSLMSNYDPASNSFSLGVIIDRLRDSSGTATTDGVCYIALATSGVGPVVQTIIGSTLQTSITNSACLIGTQLTGGKLGAGNSSVSGLVTCMPLIILAGQPRFLLGGLVYANVDIAGNTTISVTNLSSTHTYQTFPQTTTGMLGNSGDRIAMIWE